MDRVLDQKGRWRNHKVGFRMSDEEAEMLNKCVSLSGLRKQDYIMRKLTNREVVVQGNPRVYKALRNEMAEIKKELQRIEKASEVSEDFLEVLKLVTITLNGLKEETNDDK
ncbi:MAG: mobilization protein [Hespellia sp.]|nr:mobilization protein [Hespellia sp.]